MRERDIASWCAQWLKGHGFAVYGEVRAQAYGGIFDLVGLRGPDVWIVETKTGYTADVRRQAVRAGSWAHRVYVGIPWRTRPAPPRLPIERFGILYATEAAVFEARPALPEDHPYATATAAACTSWHRDHPGGVTSTEREGAPTPYQARVWTIHRRLWPHEDGMSFGALLDLTRDLFPEFRNPRGALSRLLRREPAFSLSSRKPTRSTVLATGHGVPEDCCPGSKRRVVLDA